MLYLIRHGETAWNKERRFQGQMDIPLSQHGIEQAITLGKHMRDIPLDVIYSSPLKRAHQTAQHIHHHHPSIPFHTHESLKERSYGTLEGKLLEDIIVLYPSLTFEQSWLYATVKAPEGESLMDVKSRAEKIIATILREHKGKHIAIVSHGITIRVMIHIITNIPLIETGTYSFSNTAITIIEYDEKEGGTLHVLNHTKHLKET